MADSLGEKLRQAREEKGISISEIAEQTRISPLYLESIENDDYRPLPGGIFNKGFVKSYAKYVGIDEQDAMRDYAKVAGDQQTESEENTPKKYDRPKVLTDDSSRASMFPTIIIAIIILGFMAWGVLALVNYLNSSESQATDNNIANANFKQEIADKEAAAAANTNSNAAQQPAANMDSIKAIVKSSAPAGLSITSKIDGKTEIRMINQEVPEQIFEAKETLILSYYKGSADTVSISLNGKQLATPIVPPGYRKNGFEFAITKENLKQIMDSGKIEVGGAPAASPAAATPQPAQR